MFFGIVVTPMVLVFGGGTLLLLAIWQLFTGMRWIKLPPGSHVRIHRYTGIALVLLAISHGLFGAIYALGLAVPPA